MKHKYIFSILLVLISFSFILSGQDRITLELDDFSALVVSGRIDVELIESGSGDMTITSENGQPEEVAVEQKDGELKIRIRPKIGKNDALTIKLPYKKLNRIEAYAGAVINSARDLTAEDLELTAGSGGKIELSIKATAIDVKVTQISDIILYGKTESQHIDVNTGGNYSAYELECQDTYIKASSGSEGKVTASRIIEATATAKGFIGYIGDPVSTYTKTSLGGEIQSFKSRDDVDLY